MNNINNIRKGLQIICSYQPKGYKSYMHSSFGLTIYSNLILAGPYNMKDNYKMNVKDINTLENLNWEYDENLKQWSYEVFKFET